MFLRILNNNNNNYNTKFGLQMEHVMLMVIQPIDG